MADFYGGAGKSPGINWMAIMQVLQQQGNNILSILQARKEAEERRRALEEERAIRAQERQEDREFQLSLFDRKQAAEAEKEARERADKEAERQAANRRQIRIATAQNIQNQMPALRNLLYQSAALPEDQEITPEIKDDKGNVVQNRYTVGDYRNRLQRLISDSQGLLGKVDDDYFDQYVDEITNVAAELESTGSSLITAYTKNQEKLDNERKSSIEAVKTLLSLPGIDDASRASLVEYLVDPSKVTPQKVQELIAKFPNQAESFFKGLPVEVQYQMAKDNGWIAAASGTLSPEELKNIPSYWMKDGKLTDVARAVVAYGNLQGEKELKNERARVANTISQQGAILQPEQLKGFSDRVNAAQSLEELRAVEMEFVGQVGNAAREREAQQRNDQNARAVLPVFHKTLEDIQPYIEPDAYKDYMQLQAETDPVKFQEKYLAFMQTHGRTAIEKYWAQQNLDVENKNKLAKYQLQLTEAQVKRLPLEEQRIKLDMIQTAVNTGNRSVIQGLVDKGIITQKEANFYFRNMDRDEALKNLGVSAQAIQAFNNPPNPYRNNALMGEGEYKALVDKTLAEVRQALTGIMDKDKLENTLQQLRNGYMAFYGAQAVKNDETAWNRRMDEARLGLSRAGLSLDQARLNYQLQQDARQEKRLEMNEIRLMLSSLDQRRETISAAYRTELQAVNKQIDDEGCSKGLGVAPKCQPLIQKRDQIIKQMNEDLAVIDEMRKGLENKLGMETPVPAKRPGIIYNKVDPRLLEAARVAAKETGVRVEYLIGLNAGENETLSPKPNQATGAAGYWQITRPQLQALIANPKFQQKYPELYSKLKNAPDISVVVGQLTPKEQGYLYAGYLLFNNPLALGLGKGNRYEDFAAAHFHPELLNGKSIPPNTQAFRDQAQRLQELARNNPNGITLNAARAYYREKASKVLDFNIDDDYPEDTVTETVQINLKGPSNTQFIKDLNRFHVIMDTMKTSGPTPRLEEEANNIIVKYASMWGFDPNQVKRLFMVTRVTPTNQNSYRR